MAAVRDTIGNPVESEHEEIGSQKSAGDSCKKSFTEEVKVSEHEEIDSQKSTGDSCKKPFTEEKTDSRVITDNEELQNAETDMVLVHKEQIKEINGMDIREVLQGDIDINFIDEYVRLLGQHFKLQLITPQFLYTTIQQRSCTIQRVPKEKSFVQIHFFNNHYVVSAQINGQLYVFDSIYSKEANGHNSDLLRQLTYVYEEDDESRIQFRVLQSQDAERLCGCFAAANAFAVLECIQRNIDIPKETEFDTTQMRQHLHDCLETSQLSAFPCCEQLQSTDGGKNLIDICDESQRPIAHKLDVLEDEKTIPEPDIFEARKGNEKKTDARVITDNDELQNAETDMVLVHKEQIQQINGMDIREVLQGDIDINFIDEYVRLLGQHFKLQLITPQFLYTTIQQRRSIQRVPKEKSFVQIHFFNNHYVVSAQINGQLYVFDSIHSKEANGQNSDLLRQLTYVYEEVDESHIQFRVLQSQVAERLCGCFAAANAFAILECIQQNKDIPKVTEFDTTQMRQHLHDCLETSQLSAFPCCEQLQSTDGGKNLIDISDESQRSIAHKLDVLEDEQTIPEPDIFNARKENEKIPAIQTSKVVPFDSFTHLLVDISTMPKGYSPSDVFKDPEKWIDEECIRRVTVLFLPGISKALREEVDKLTVNISKGMKTVDKGEMLKTLKIKKEGIIGFISLLVGFVDVCSPNITKERILLVSDEQTKKSVISVYEINNFQVVQWPFILSKSTAGLKMKNCLGFISGCVQHVILLDLDNAPNFFDIYEENLLKLKGNVHIICFANKKTNEIKIENKDIRSKVPKNITCTFAPVCENQKNQVDFDMIKYMGLFIAHVCHTKNNLISINVVSNDNIFKWVCPQAKKLQENSFPDLDLKILFWSPKKKEHFNKLFDNFF